MTDHSTGESRAGTPPSGAAGSFGDAAATMANETEVEEPVTPRPEHEQVQDRDDVRDDQNDGASNGEDDAPPEPSAPAEERPEAPGEPEGAEAPAADDPLAVAERALAERTADLQRLQAEYLNYKRRVDRDRDLVRENATYAALSPIVEVLDTIDRAREHGDLDEGFQAVADQLERAVSNAGLVRYGAPGDAFDPRLHEALSHIGEDPDVQVTTCKVVAKAGYRIGDRVVRAAQVLVVDPVSA